MKSAGEVEIAMLVSDDVGVISGKVGSAVGIGVMIDTGVDVFICAVVVAVAHEASTIEKKQIIMVSFFIFVISHSPKWLSVHFPRLSKRVTHFLSVFPLL
jgi:hypothetical protein